MTIQGRVFNKVAICTSRVAANNFFSVRADDIETTILEPGDNVRVRLTRADNQSPVDSDIYDSTLQKSNQVYIPKDTREKLELESGDIIKYIIVPKKAFPGLRDGPVRDTIKEVVRGEEEVEREQERPERETTTDTFSAPMQQTGQITVPSDTMDKMGLLQGDNVTVTVMWKGSDKTVTKQIGTGNRITLNKDTREELGLEAGDEPQIRIAVFG